MTDNSDGGRGVDYRLLNKSWRRQEADGDEYNGTAGMQHRRFNLDKEKPAPVNWRRGMFRLWILASAAWVMAWFIFFAIEYIGGELTPRQLFVAPVVLLGPPVALLLFGLATRWAFRGFEVDDRS